MAGWEPLRELRNYLEAPDTRGIYEIGFKKIGHVAPQAAAYGLHAAGYPHNFLPMYVGKHQQSIRKRLGEHFVGTNSVGRQRKGSRASKSIKAYYEELLPELQAASSKIPQDMKYPLDGLYFTCFPVSDPASFEAFVRLGNFYYPWNRKDETGARENAEGSRSADYEYIYRKKATLFIGG